MENEEDDHLASLEEESPESEHAFLNTPGMSIPPGLTDLNGPHGFGGTSMGGSHQMIAAQNF